MLSILIPIHNCKIVRLVEKLVDQCQKEKIDFEIICLDDGSKSLVKEHNRVVNGMFGVNYVELSKNSGRSKIRNQLGALARYKYHLYLDCDSKIISKKFVSRYLETIDKMPDTVLGGGRIYSDTAPANPKKYLHWFYGSRRETKKAARRNQRITEYFHSNNFVITSDIFALHRFNEDITGYGYEDLAYAEKLVASGCAIHHFDNPVLHGSLETNDVFLDKMRDGMSNLASLFHNRQLRQTRLLRFYKKTQVAGLEGLCFILLRSQINKMIRHLKGSNPNLIVLDCYKFYYFLKYTKEHI